MIVRSPLADLSLPNLDFSSFVLARGRRLPDKAALIDGVTGETLTFGEFTSRVDVLAGGLLGRRPSRWRRMRSGGPGRLW
jgi:hypothetical protein